MKKILLMIAMVASFVFPCLGKLVLDNGGFPVKFIMTDDTPDSGVLEFVNAKQQHVVQTYNILAEYNIIKFIYVDANNEQHVVQTYNLAEHFRPGTGSGSASLNLPPLDNDGLSDKRIEIGYKFTCEPCTSEADSICYLPKENIGDLHITITDAKVISNHEEAIQKDFEKEL